jgi:hypothetical protein
MRASEQRPETVTNTVQTPVESEVGLLKRYMSALYLGLLEQEWDRSRTVAFGPWILLHILLYPLAYRFMPLPERENSRPQNTLGHGRP